MAVYIKRLYNDSIQYRFLQGYLNIMCVHSIKTINSVEKRHIFAVSLVSIRTLPKKQRPKLM